MAFSSLSVQHDTSFWKTLFLPPIFPTLSIEPCNRAVTKTIAKPSKWVALRTTESHACHFSRSFHRTWIYSKRSPKEVFESPLKNTFTGLPLFNCQGNLSRKKRHFYSQADRKDWPPISAMKQIDTGSCYFINIRASHCLFVQIYAAPAQRRQSAKPLILRCLAAEWLRRFVILFLAVQVL